MKAKYLGILGLLSSGTIVGYIWGNHVSPDASKPDCARQYLAMYGPWARVDGTHGNITLKAGSRIYAYTTGDAAVTVRELSAADMLKAPMPHRDMDKDFDKLIGVAVAETGGASLLSTAMESAAGTGTLAKFSKGEQAVVLFATGGSIGLGYWLGHHPEPDTSEPKFQETLSTDVGLWSRYEAAWRLEYDQLLNSAIDSAKQWRAAPAERASTIPAVIRAHDNLCGRGGRLIGSTYLDDATPHQTIVSMHPELCQQVDTDPRLLAVVNQPPAVTSPLLQPFTGTSLGQYSVSNTDLVKALSTPQKKANSKHIDIFPAKLPASTSP